MSPTRSHENSQTRSDRSAEKSPKPTQGQFISMSNGEDEEDKEDEEDEEVEETLPDWCVVTDEERSEMLAALTVVSRHSKRSEHKTIALFSVHVNVVKGFETKDRQFFVGMAVTCMNANGIREKGLLTLIYYSRAVTSGSQYGIVVFSLAALRYIIVHLKNPRDCLLVKPIEKCAPKYWKMCQKLPVLNFIAEKHRDRVHDSLPPAPKKSASTSRARRPATRRSTRAKKKAKSRAEAEGGLPPVREGDKPFQCTTCGKKYKKNGHHYKAHVADCPPKPKPNPKEKPRSKGTWSLPCSCTIISICYCAVMDKIVLLRSCDGCGKVLHTKAGFNTHRNRTCPALREGQTISSVFTSLFGHT